MLLPLILFCLLRGIGMLVFRQVDTGYLNIRQTSLSLPANVLPKAIIDDQKRHKVFKIVIGDGQAAIHIGLANDNIGLDQNSPKQVIVL